MQSPLAKKLLIKEGRSVLVLNAPEGFVERLAPLPPGVLAEEQARGRFDVVQVFVRDTKELARHAPKAIKAVADGGILWIAYPKKTSKVKTDLSRDEGWGAINALDWDVVSLVAIDDTWSSLRFKPAVRRR